MKILSEFRRFMNAIRKFGADKEWHYVAEAENEIVLVAVNRDTDPKKARVLEALIDQWGGKVNER